MRTLFRRRSESGVPGPSRPRSVATADLHSGTTTNSSTSSAITSTAGPVMTRTAPISIAIPEEPPNYDSLDASPTSNSHLHSNGAGSLGNPTSPLATSPISLSGSPDVSVMFGASPRYEEIDLPPDIAQRQRQIMASSRRNTISDALFNAASGAGPAHGAPSHASSSGGGGTNGNSSGDLSESPGGTDWWNENLLDIPMPPASAGSLPVYSPNLARNELRLISTVHVHDSHPAAAFFNSPNRQIDNDDGPTMGTSGSSGPGEANGGVYNGSNPVGSFTTDGKRIRVTITKGADVQGKGIAVKRGGVIEGSVEVGKGDHGVGLDITIIGVVNTSFSFRGQWSLLDSTPILAEKVVLWGSAMNDAQTSTEVGTMSSTSGEAPVTSNSAEPVASGSGSGSGNGVTNDDELASSTSTSNNPLTRTITNSAVSSNTATTGPTNGSGTATNSTPTTASSAFAMGAGATRALPISRSSSGAGMPALPISPRPARRSSFSVLLTGSPARGATPSGSSPGGTGIASSLSGGGTGVGGSGGMTTLQPGSTFKFSIPMPTSTFGDGRSELPPTCVINQVGMQSTVEYYLRVKLSRSRFRMNETMHIPIKYDLRGYISPRRLRALSIGESDNPGWKKVKLKGGTSKVGNAGMGIEASLLLPCPPIIFITSAIEPPKIPFHLHFFSSSHPLALATFANPLECKFVVRVMRATMIRLGVEKQYRREEVPATVEIWRDDDENGNITGGRGENEPTRIRLNQEGTRSPTHPAQPSLDEHASRVTPSATTGSGFSVQPTGNIGGGGLESSHQINGSSPTNSLDHHNHHHHTSAPVTTIHLQGEVQLHKEGLRSNLPQSLYCPDIVVSYVLEVGIQPKRGAVKEAFEHLWGGGGLEVVWGC